MAYATTRISPAAHRTLREMSKAQGKPITGLLDEAVEALRRLRFLEQVNEAYGALRASPQAWEGVQRERQAWDVTLPDGLAVAEGRATYPARSRPQRSPKGR